MVLQLGALVQQIGQVSRNPFDFMVDLDQPGPSSASLLIRLRDSRTPPCFGPDRRRPSGPVDAGRACRGFRHRRPPARGLVQSSRSITLTSLGRIDFSVLSARSAFNSCSQACRACLGGRMRRHRESSFDVRKSTRGAASRRRNRESRWRFGTRPCVHQRCRNCAIPPVNCSTRPTRLSATPPSRPDRSPHPPSPSARRLRHEEFPRVATNSSTRRFIAMNMRLRSGSSGSVGLVGEQGVVAPAGVLRQVQRHGPLSGTR